MKIFTSENDRHDALRVAILNIAKFHNVANSEYKTNQEIYYSVMRIPSPLMPYLEGYINAYNKWFDFYHPKERIEQQSGSPYSFNNTEQNELAVLMAARENNLDALLEQLEQLRNS